MLPTNRLVNGKKTDFTSVVSGVCRVSFCVCGLTNFSKIKPRPVSKEIHELTINLNLSVDSASIRLTDNSGTLLGPILVLTSEKVKRCVKHVSIRKKGI